MIVHEAKAPGIYPWLDKVKAFEADGVLGMQVVSTSGDREVVTLPFLDADDAEFQAWVLRTLSELNEKHCPHLGQFGIRISRDGEVFTRDGAVA